MERRNVLALISGSVVMSAAGVLVGCGKDEKKVDSDKATTPKQGDAAPVTTPTPTPTQPQPQPQPQNTSSTSTSVESNDGLKDGKDYRILTNIQPITDTKKVEVVEFFSYICPHCNALENDLEKWAKTLPKDVTLRRVPINLHNFDAPQKAFYVLESMGKLEALHKKVFDAIHVGQAPYKTDENFADIVAKLGIDRAQFLAQMKSFGIDAKAKQANKFSEDCGVNGVPTFVIQGKYRTSQSFTGIASHQELLALIGKIADKARQELPKK